MLVLICHDLGFNVIFSFLNFQWPLWARDWCELPDLAGSEPYAEFRTHDEPRQPQDLAAKWKRPSKASTGFDFYHISLNGQTRWLVVSFVYLTPPGWMNDSLWRKHDTTNILQCYNTNHKFNVHHIISSTEITRAVTRLCTFLRFLEIRCTWKTSLTCASHGCLTSFSKAVSCENVFYPISQYCWAIFSDALG